jgi:putative glutamine amidotransferase
MREARRKAGAGTPVIGITVDANFGRDDEKPEPGIGGGGTAVFWLNKSYVDAVEAAGGIPVLIPVITSPKKIRLYLSMIDGLILSGGDFDIDPKLYGEKPVPQIGTLKPGRTLMEMALLKGALRTGMPTLGVCGGLQAINVALGGSLWQDIPSQIPSAVKHSQNPEPSTKPSHEVSVVPGSLLADIAGGIPVLKVNSTHHQCVKKIGKGLVASSISPDGLVESVELRNRGERFMLGVQWHPERLCGSDETSARIFRKFVDSAAEFRKER